MLVIIVGNTCTGKTTINQELSRLGYCTIEASTFFKRAIENELAGRNRDKLPLDIFAMTMIVNEFGDLLNKAVLTGIRRERELEFLRQNVRESIVVAIKTNYEECYKRALERKRESIPTYEKFINENINNDLKIGLKRLIDTADITIINNGKSKNLFLDNCIDLLLPYIVR